MFQCFNIITDLQALLLVPVLFLPVILLPQAAFSHTARPVALPSVRTVEVWPCNHTPHEHTVSSISDSTTSPSPISTTGVSYSTVEASHTVNSGREGAVSSSHEQVSSQLDQLVTEHSVTQLAGKRLFFTAQSLYLYTGYML